MREYRGITVGGGNVVKPPLTLRLEDTKTQGFSSYSSTYYFNYLFGNKELLARQVVMPLIRLIFVYTAFPQLSGYLGSV